MSQCLNLLLVFGVDDGQVSPPSGSEIMVTESGVMMITEAESAIMITE